MQILSPDVGSAESTPKAHLKHLPAIRIFDTLENFTAFLKTAQFSVKAELVVFWIFCHIDIKEVAHNSLQCRPQLENFEEFLLIDLQLNQQW